MRWWLSLVFVLAWPSLAQAQQMPGPVGEPQGVWREQIHWVPMTDEAGMQHLLYARICRPAGEAPARIVLIAHGSPGPAPMRRLAMAPAACDGEAARWFLDRGYAVVAGMRRGYGATGGDWVEGDWACDNRDYLRAALVNAHDIAAMVDYAATLPFARPGGMVLVGHSAGGWASIAYDLLPHPRVTAFVNFAGGRGGHEYNRPSSNCHPERLAEAAGRFGRTATTPMLWIYAENDSFFAPAIAAAMYAAYTQNGGKAEFEQLGPYDNDGPRLFFGQSGSRVWGPLVERYLASRPAQ